MNLAERNRQEGLVNSFRTAYPFKSRWFDQQGFDMHLVDEGAGRPVLMVHGNPTWSFMWRSMITKFRGRYRCVAPDHIGMGLSEKPTAGYDYVLERRVNDLERLVLALDLKDITLMVHDWGGPIGFGVAVRHPERFHRFVVMNTSVFLAHGIPKRIGICRLPLFGPLAVRGANGFVRAALPMAMGDRSRLSPEARRGLLAPYDSWANRIGVYEFVQDIPLSPHSRSHATMKVIESRVGELADRPMKIFWGMKDWCFHEGFLKLWTERFPSADLETFDDAGHYLLEDAADRIAPAALAFLDGDEGRE